MSGDALFRSVTVTVAVPAHVGTDEVRRAVAHAFSPSERGASAPPKVGDVLAAKHTTQYPPEPRAGAIVTGKGGIAYQRPGNVWYSAERTQSAYTWRELVDACGPLELVWLPS